MKKIYIGCMKNKLKAIVLALFTTTLFTSVKAQVDISATGPGGSLSGSYPNLGTAFAVINEGGHQGDITIILNDAIIEEGNIPAQLNGKTADPANYTSITIRPGLTDVTVRGNPLAGRGIIELYGVSNFTINGDHAATPGITRNITFENYAANTIKNTSIIRVAVNATSAPNANNISILNCDFIGNAVGRNVAAATGADDLGNLSYGIFVGGGATGMANNDMINALPSTVDALDAIAPNGSSINNMNILQNGFTSMGRAIYFRGGGQSVGSNINIIGNTIGATGSPGAYPHTAITSTVYASGIYVSGSEDVNITGNVITNMFSYLPIVMTGIQLGDNIGGGTILIQGNTIDYLANNGAATTTRSAIGIGVASADNDYEITQNEVRNITANSTNLTGLAPAGISVASNSAASIYKNSIRLIRNANPGHYAVYGIHLGAGNGHAVYNNFISGIFNSLTAGGASSTAINRTLSGIHITSGNNHLVVNNSVHLYHAVNYTGTTSNTYAALTIASASSANLVIKNNILANRMSNSATSTTLAFVSLNIPFTATSGVSMNLDINNNAYYSSTTSMGGIARVNGVATAILTAPNFEARNNNLATNLRNFTTQIGLATNDDHSLAIASPSGPFTSNDDLHIAGVSSILESAGVPVGIGDDYDGDTRSATFPDIGADEFSKTMVDTRAPYIKFTPLANICNAITTRTLVANITDPSGVPTAGGGVPMLYWGLSSGSGVPPATYTGVAGVSTGGGNYSFTFGTGAALGQWVTYYIVAQDNAATPNVMSMPSAGSAGWAATPPSVSTPPTQTSLYQYSVSTSMGGPYLVGTGQPAPYNTLPTAIDAYNSACITSPVIFLLTDAVYNIGAQMEIYNPEVTSAAKGLTIRPNLGVTSLITATLPSGQAVFKLRGAKYVNINGNNIGSPGGSGVARNLTIRNLGAGNVVWIGSRGVGNGATNNTIVNTIAHGADGTGTTFTVFLQSSGTTAGGVAEAQNNNNQYINNHVYGAQYGISLVGPTGNETGNIIRHNNIGSPLATTAQNFTYRNMFVAQQQNVIIEQNELRGLRSSVASSASTNTVAGIYIGGTISGGSIARNKIYEMRNVNTGGWSVSGIALRSSNAVTNLNIHNNFIWDVMAYGWSSTNPFYNGSGILISLGGGYNIYYNSISMNTNENVANTTTAALYIYTGTTIRQLNIRNNIFANFQTVGKSFSVFNQQTDLVFSNVNYNNYYSTYAPLSSYNGTVTPSIAAIMAASGGDVNSMNVDPQYINQNSNLHLADNSMLNHAGVFISGPNYTTDIDGDTRATGTGNTAPDIGADEFTPPNCGPGPLAGGTITTNIAELCVTGTVSLAATATAYGEGISYQWQWALAAGGPWNNITGATSPFGAVYTLNNNTTYFRLLTTCSFGGTGTSNVVSVVVNNPTITGTNSGMGTAVRCGFGPVTLTATSSAGTNINWYDAPTGGLPLGTGTSFVTNVTTSRLFYVDASVPGVTGAVGPASPTAQGGTIGTQTIDWEVYFDVTQPTQLISIDIFPMTSGQTGTITLHNSNGTLLGTYNFTTSVSGGATPQTIPINYALPIGTNYYFDTNLPSGGVRRNTSNGSYPYTSAAIDITRNGFSAAYYMGLYNWLFTSSCASQPRTPVSVTVTPAPVFTMNPSGDTTNLCSGSSVSLNIANPAIYTTFTWYNVRSNAMSGGANIGTGNTISVSPTANTWYYVVGSGAPGGCARIDSVYINVKPVPSPLVLTPFPIPPYCASNLPIRMDMTGGALNNIVSLFEDFENGAPGWTTYDNNVGGTPTEGEWMIRLDGYVDNGTFHSNDNSKFMLTSSDNQGSGSTTDAFLESPSFSLQNFTSANLTFYTYFNWLSADEYARVEISPDGGSTWHTIREYRADVGAVANFALITINLATPGVGAAPGIISGAFNDNLLGETNVKVRFNYYATFGWNWAIDNVLVTGDQQLNITWTPNYNLYLNYSGTVPNIILGTPYTSGTHAPQVFAAPDVETLYTATVTSPAGCVRTASINIPSINNRVEVDIASSVPTLEICEGQSVTFTATPTNPGTNYGYFWYVNGVQQAATAMVPTWTTTGLNNGDKVWVMLTSNISCATNNPARSDTLEFIVNTAQPVSVTVASSDVDDIICAGESVTFTATPVNGGSTPVYQWLLNSNPVGTNSNTYTTTTLANGDVVTVQLTSSLTPCAVDNPATSAPITMTVNPLLVPSVTLNAVPGTEICPGMSVTFTPVPVNGGPSPTYQWFLNGNPVGTGLTYTNASLTTGDEIYAIMTTSEACYTSATATSPISTISISGSALPVSVVLSASSLSSCTPTVTQTTITATGTNPGTVPNYEFFVNSISVQSGTSNTYSYFPVNGDVVEVILTSDLPCASNNPANSNTLTMTVLPAPATPTITPGGATNFCTGGSVTLTSSAATGNVWSTGATTQSIVVSTSGSYTVTTSNGVCTSPPSAATVVTVNPIPATPTITVTGGTAPYCAGVSYTLTSSAATGNVWSTGATTQSIVVNTAGTYTVSVTLLGCTSAASAPVVINPLPNVSISGSNEYCDAPVLLTANASVATGTVTGYQWYNGATPVGTGLNTYTANGVGSYTVVAFTAAGCNATSAAHVLGLPSGPLSGIYTISAAPLSCTNFPSIKDAISALNTRTVAGNVTFNVAAGFVEPATGGKLVMGTTALNNSVNAGPYNIIFQKNGAGANPLINAYTGTASTSNTANPDGIWVIAGTDNVTIDAIDLQDANLTPTTQMEFGYGAFKLNNDDGVQNLTIQNCNITLTNNNTGAATSIMPEGATGIVVMNATHNAAITPLAPTNVSGANSNNKFYSNTISQVNTGIAIFGFVGNQSVTPTPALDALGDHNNDIGGNDPATGNTIVDFGGGGAQASAGIEVVNQWDINISYNTINNNTGSHVYHGGLIRGIWANGSTSTSVVSNVGPSMNSNVNITHNAVTVKNTGSPQPVSAIDVAMGGSMNAAIISTGVINITDNVILNSGNNAASPIGAAQNVINCSPLCEKVNIINNTIDGVHSSANGNFYVIYYGQQPTAAAAAAASTYSIRNNIIKNVTKVSTAAGTLRGITSIGAPTYSYIRGNLIENLTFSAATNTSNFDGINLSAFSQNVFVDSNIVRNMDATQGGTTAMNYYGIRITDANLYDKSISYNEVYNLTTSATGNITMGGISTTVGKINTLTGNKVYNLHNSNTAGGAVYGILLNNATVEYFVSKNDIYNLTIASANPTMLAGISFNAGVGATLTNNFISQLYSPNASSTGTNDLLRGISIVSTTANSYVKVYYNTIYLDATSSGANFSTTGIYHPNAVITQAPLDLRNNVIVNNSVPNGTGYTSVFKRNSSQYLNLPTSNYNLFYTEPGANRYVYFGTGTQTWATLAQYQANNGGRDVNSVSEMPVFVNTAVQPYDLHMNEDDNCLISKIGNNSGILMADDFDGDPRAVVSPFLTDIGADEYINNSGGSPYTWAGVNTDWNDPQNWCTGVPEYNHNIIIPTGLTNYPVITGNANEVGNLTIQPGASVTLQTGATLNVYGTNFTINGTLTNNGLLNFTGSAAQTLGTGTGTIAAMHSFEVNNPAGLSIVKNIGVSGEIRPSEGVITLNNATITLLSTATGTASVTEVAPSSGFSYVGTGKFVVENYIAASGNEGWRFLSIPTNNPTQTIRDAWMEGQTPASYNPTGYGTQIVGPFSAGTGFDVNTLTTGIKTFNSVTNTWITTPGTNVPINNDKGYMIFVRGDRGSNTFGSSSNTILRTEGPIKTGTHLTTHNTINQFVSIGNPFPSAINFANTTRTGLGNYYWLWDPKLGTYGGYQVFTLIAGNWIPTPGGGSYAANNYIESGQAFLVYTSAPTSSISIEENDKASGSHPVTRINSDVSILKVDIYNNADSMHLTDGVLSVFDPAFNTAVDEMDAVKASNFNEGFGIVNSAKMLSVDFRAMPAISDTIQYSFGTLRANTPYRIRLTAQNLTSPGLEAWLEDKYLNTYTPVSLEAETDYDFTISNVPASYAPERFRVIFKLARPLPVRFTRVEAVVDGKDVDVKWNVSDEININTYTVQRSVDGRNFTNLLDVDATGARSYDAVDYRPGNGVFYYRIRSNGHANDVQYSEIVSVVLNDGGKITVYPNPVQQDRVVKVDMTNMAAGKYSMQLVSTTGQVVLRKNITHPGGSAVYNLELGKYITNGVYTLQIRNGKLKTVVKILY